MGARQSAPQDSQRPAEHGQIVVGWLIKVLLVLAVVGFVLIEAGAVVINRLQAGDVAGQAASEAGLTYSNTNNIDAARERAEEFVEQNDAEFVEAELLDGRMAVTVRKRASTRLVHEIDALEGLTTATVTESAPLR